MGRSPHSPARLRAHSPQPAAATNGVAAGVLGAVRENVRPRRILEPGFQEGAPVLGVLPEVHGKRGAGEGGGCEVVGYHFQTNDYYSGEVDVEEQETIVRNFGEKRKCVSFDDRDYVSFDKWYVDYGLYRRRRDRHRLRGRPRRGGRVVTRTTCSSATVEQSDVGETRHSFFGARMSFML